MSELKGEICSDDFEFQINVSLQIHVEMLDGNAQELYEMLMRKYLRFDDKLILLLPYASAHFNILYSKIT